MESKHLISCDGKVEVKVVRGMTSPPALQNAFPPMWSWQKRCGSDSETTGRSFTSSLFFLRLQSHLCHSWPQQGKRPFGQRDERGAGRQQQHGGAGMPGRSKRAHPQTQEVEAQPDAGAAHWQPGRLRGESSLLLSSSLIIPEPSRSCERFLLLAASSLAFLSLTDRNFLCTTGPDSHFFCAFSTTVYIFLPSAPTQEPQVVEASSPQWPCLIHS